MRKFWTRVATFALVLIVMVSFSACALFTTDLDKKYSPYTMVMTTANDDIAVSRQELYYAYLTWGYEYGQQTSMSGTKVLESIAETLLNNKILEKQSIAQFGAITDAEEALALKQVYETFNQSLRKEIYEILGLEDQIDENNDQADDSDNPYNDIDKPYEPSILVSYENGERVFTMDLSSYKDADGTGVLDSTDYQYYVPSVPSVASQKIAKQAISKMIRSLQTVEKGFTQLKTPERDYLQPNNECFAYLTKEERAVLNREIDRIVCSNRTSILVNRISTAYNLGFMTLQGEDAKQAWQDYLNRSKDFTTWADKINGNLPEGALESDMPAYFGCGRSVATNIADKAIKYYLEKGVNAINHQKNFPDTDLESTLMSSGLTDVYYIPNDVANNLFTVSHILIGFTDEQKTEYQNIINEKNPSDNTQNRLNKLYTETTSNGVSAADILIEVQTALKQADNLDEKCQIFRNFINQYNTDPGMQNLDQLNSNNQPQYEYLMSNDSEKSKMVEAFTKASIELFDAGVKGAISGLVWSEYGAHIIMYTRDVADFIFTGVAGMESESVELLKMNYADTLFAPLTSYGNRTCFDTLVDSYFTRDYTNYRNSILKDYKHEHQVTIVDSEFESFFK